VIGCQYSHPSQLRYESLAETSYNIFTFYFDEAIKCVELKNIRSQFKKYALESDVPQSYIEYFIKNFKWGLSGGILSKLLFLRLNKPILLQISLVSNPSLFKLFHIHMHSLYFIKNFKWAWWLEEDEMKRSMVGEIRETTEISSILDL
jgi:hypothetical protein